MGKRRLESEILFKTELYTKSGALLLGGRQAPNQRNGINIPVEKRTENGVCSNDYLRGLDQLHSNILKFLFVKTYYGGNW